LNIKNNTGSITDFKQH